MTHFDLRFLSSVHTSVRLLIPFETHNIKLRDFHDFRTHDMETDSHKLSYESNRNVSCQDRVSRWISFFNGIPFKTRISIFKRVQGGSQIFIIFHFIPNWQYYYFIFNPPYLIPSSMQTQFPALKTCHCACTLTQWQVALCKDIRHAFHVS